MHARRIADDLEFQWWSEDVAHYRAEAAKKYLSLNEAERRAERERQERQRKERQAIRKEKGLDLDPLADETDDGLTAEIGRAACRAREQVSPAYVAADEN